jgi:HAD superfamily hydrolase (TIGR01509 family)
VTGVGPVVTLAVGRGGRVLAAVDPAREADVACPVGLVAEEQLVKANMARTQKDPKEEAWMRAVLFDWRGTLVHDPPPDWWVKRALVRLGRPVETEQIAHVIARIKVATETPEFRAAELAMDCDPVAHRAATLGMFERAGLDAALAEMLYELDFEPECHPVYPDVVEVLRRLHVGGVRVVVVSDIHFDLRPEFDQVGLAPYIDGYVLSFEHGVQKPDRRIFDIALKLLDIGPQEALMVGDRSSRDGAAVTAGITTILLPSLPDLHSRGLNILLPLFGMPLGGLDA